MTLLMPMVGVTYPVAQTASGPFIRDAHGREWIDGSSGAIACSIGHGHPHVIDAVRRQMDTASFLYRTQFANAPALQLADRLCAKLGYAAAFFVNSGSEAVETAIRLAQQFWREAGQPSKTRILSRKISYHGSTTGALALSGHWPRRRSGGALPGEPTLPTPYPLRAGPGQDAEGHGLACAQAVEDEILRLGASNVAAVILEPIVGASGGAIVPPAGYLASMRAICDRHDVLLIGDEVLTGLGRTGRWLGMDHGSVKADIVCLGKGLNAGYLPISGILANARIAGVLTSKRASFALGQTHSNHPVAAAAANAVLDVLEDEGLVPRAATMGAYLGERLRDMAEDLPYVAEVRGQGMLWGLELVRDDISFDPWPAETRLADAVVRSAFAEDLIVYPVSGFIAGSRGDAILVAPPFNTPKAVLDTLVERLARALANAMCCLQQTHSAEEVYHVVRAA
jgi:adenosylmethionine-8-amino-7-oxononanoate aminotransferase